MVDFVEMSVRLSSSVMYYKPLLYREHNLQIEVQQLIGLLSPY